MKKIRALFLVFAVAILAACTPKGIIPKKKMAAIQADMLIFDQYAGADNQMRRFSDTCAVYKPLLRSYGYTTDDYFHSMDYYLDNVRDMEEILNKAESILNKRKAKILRNIEKNSRKVDTLSLKKMRGEKNDATEEGAMEEEN